MVPWQQALGDQDRKRQLIEQLRILLVPAVTQHLPPTWQVDPATQDFELWIEARVPDAATSMVCLRGTPQMIGLLVLPGALEADSAILRIGYVLGRAHWGQGYATELVRGLIDWARDAGVSTLHAGVEVENAGSVAVLKKAGFVRAGLTNDGVEAYWLDIGPQSP